MSWGHFGGCYFSLLFIFLSPTPLSARPLCERLLGAVCAIVVMHCVGLTACLEKLPSKAIIETKIIKVHQSRRQNMHESDACNKLVLKLSRLQDVIAQTLSHTYSHIKRYLCNNSFLLSRINSTLDIPVCVWTTCRCGFLLDLRRGKFTQVSLFSSCALWTDKECRGLSLSQVRTLHTDKNMRFLKITKKKNTNRKQSC